MSIRRITSAHLFGYICGLIENPTEVHNAYLSHKGLPAHKYPPNLISAHNLQNPGRFLSTIIFKFAVDAAACDKDLADLKMHLIRF